MYFNYECLCLKVLYRKTNPSYILLKMFHGELESLVDSGTTHTILRNRQLFVDFLPIVSKVSTMTGSDNIIKSRGIAQFFMPNGTLIKVEDALYAPRAPRTLLSFKAVRDNDLHLHTYVENGTEYLINYHIHKELTYSYCGEV